MPPVTQTRNALPKSQLNTSPSITALGGGPISQATPRRKATRSVGHSPKEKKLLGLFPAVLAELPLGGEAVFFLAFIKNRVVKAISPVVEQSYGRKDAITHARSFKAAVAAQADQPLDSRVIANRTKAVYGDIAHQTGDRPPKEVAQGRAVALVTQAAKQIADLDRRHGPDAVDALFGGDPMKALKIGENGELTRSQTDLVHAIDGFSKRDRQNELNGHLRGKGIKLDTTAAANLAVARISMAGRADVAQDAKAINMTAEAADLLKVSYETLATGVDRPSLREVSQRNVDSVALSTAQRSAAQDSPDRSVGVQRSIEA